MAWSKESRQKRGYGKAHEAMRAHLMATVVLCEECTRNGRTTVGKVADHRIPKAQGGTDDRDNYQWLCQPCSDAKTILEKGGTPRPAIGEDGWPVE